MSRDLLSLLLAGGIGYVAGRAPFQQWEGFINKYQERMSYITYQKIAVPAGFYGKIYNGQWLYTEAITAYLVGLPDACLPVILRCLDVGLKKLYEEVQKKECQLKLYHLIEWAEQYLGGKKELAHGFRILRNLIHEETVVEEQDAIEAIRHTTQILNVIFPFVLQSLFPRCLHCQDLIHLPLTFGQNYIGNAMTLKCPKCGKTFSYIVSP
jgi:hypothetical protein